MAAFLQSHNRLVSVQIQGSSRARTFVLRVFPKCSVFEIKALAGVRIGVRPQFIYFYHIEDVERRLPPLQGWLPLNTGVVKVSMEVVAPANAPKYAYDAFWVDLKKLPTRMIMSEDLALAVQANVTSGETVFDIIDERLQNYGESIECVDVLSGLTPLLMCLHSASPNVPLAMYFLSKYKASVHNRGSDETRKTPLQQMRDEPVTYASLLTYYEANLK